MTLEDDVGLRLLSDSFLHKSLFKNDSYKQVLSKHVLRLAMRSGISSITVLLNQLLLGIVLCVSL